MPDHVPMCITIPPKHPVACVIGFLKGKSAIAIARLSGKERNFSGEHFWARGYYYWVTKETLSCRIVLWEHASPRQARKRDVSRRTWMAWQPPRDTKIGTSR